MKPLFRLDGKVALVTGAAQGLGEATVKVLAGQGAKVAAADLNLDGAEAVAREIGTDCRAYWVNVADEKECRRLVDSVERDFGRIDILVNNAGICPRLPFADSTAEDWDRLMEVNAKSQYFLCQAVCAVMKRQGGGRIINIASTGGRTGSFADASIYSGTKGAIVMFTKSIAREVAADGILINCIAPGVLDTGMMRELPEEKSRAICEQIPLRRLGSPEEIAYAVAFLASDECSYATGATFDVNGGWIML